MWRKASRLAGGRLPRSEERGAWAELYFMMLSAGLGMKVSRPFSNVGRYDVGVENQTRVLRVQVKSTIFKQHESKTSRKPKECYSLNVTGPQRQKYAPGTVDFFAILLIPIDEWYIIPFEAIGTTVSSIHFTPKSKRQKYREYREAWHLLRETGLTIQACADPEWAEATILNVQRDAAVESHVSQRTRDMGHPRSWWRRLTADSSALRASE